MIRCEQCFYRYPAGTLFCDVCGAALSPWNVEIDSALLDATFPSDDVQFTFDEPAHVSLPFSPYYPNSGRLVSDSDLFRSSSEEPSDRRSAPSAAAESDQRHDQWRDEEDDERQRERQRRAEEIVVGMDAAPKCVWVILTGGQTFELAGKTQYLIGRRDPANNVMPDIDLTNWYGAAKGVSRVHASLYITSIGVFVEDLESRNETMRNEDRLLPRQRYALKDGDVLRLGQMVLHVQFAEEP